MGDMFGESDIQKQMEKQKSQMDAEAEQKKQQLVQQQIGIIQSQGGPKWYPDSHGPTTTG